MTLGQVIGPVVSTQKHSSYKGRRILIVQPVDKNKKSKGSSFLAFDDFIRAGPGDLVLVCREGNGCRQIWGDKMAPVNTVIVGVVDSVCGS